MGVVIGIVMIVLVFIMLFLCALSIISNEVDEIEKEQIKDDEDSFKKNNKN